MNRSAPFLTESWDILTAKGTQMLRRLLVTSLLVLLGAHLSVTGAAALPYPAPVVPSFSAGVGAVEPGGSVTLTASGFLPGETVDLTVEYAAPSGLRRAAALVLLAAAGVPAGQVVADGGGSFSTSLKLDQVGLATITATGRLSGFSVSTVVRVGTAPAAAATTTPAAAGNGGGTADGAAPLAWTGTSLAGPLAMGAGLLAAGLLLLFFGTRMVIRRRVRQV